VDSPENLDELDRAGQRKGVRIPVVVEVDIGVHRCGVEPGEPTVALSREAHARAGLRYLGLLGYEGHARDIGDPEARHAEAERSVRLLVDSAEQCRQAGLPVEIVSCGGTGIEEISA